MKLAHLHTFCSRRRDGSAVLVVLTLLAVIGALLVCNNQMLHQLKMELQRVEEKQLKRYAPPGADARPAVPPAKAPRS